MGKVERPTPHPPTLSFDIKQEVFLKLKVLGVYFHGNLTTIGTSKSILFSAKRKGVCVY